jgi:hypothetical protein
MNNISLDGVPATDMGNGSQLKVTVSQDAVAEEFWPTEGASKGQVTVPSALERQGNFSQTVDVNNRPIVVRDLITATLPSPATSFRRTA